MSSPFTDFESNFRSAETLLKVYCLLDTLDGPQTEHILMQKVRDLLMAGDNEELILLISDLFMGVVRENANVRPAVFKRESLNMLLRQAVVAACSAIDVYYPALLREHLPQVIRIKQRNFMPTDKNTRDFLKEFQLSLDDGLRMMGDQHPENVLGELFFEYLEYLKRKTLSNSQGVAASLQILGIDDSWNKIAQRLGTTKDPLTKQFDGLISRRNDIVHRGDRSSKDPHGTPQAIHLSWAESHIDLAHGVVQASNELVTEQVASLDLPEPEPVAGNG